MRNYFIFDGKDSRDFGLYINGHKTFDSPSRNYSLYDVPGRSGSFAEDIKTFQNVELAYNSSFIFDDFDSNFSELKNYLLSRSGYKRLTDTYHPDEFRKAMFRKAIQPTMNESNEVGAFDLVFECQPQRFLVSGETPIEITASDFTIINPTYFNSKPLIRVYGTGTVEIGSDSFTITSADEYTDVDSDVMDCYKGTINCNNKVELTGFRFPELAPGRNGVTFTSGISKIIVTPRWYVI